MNLIKYKILFTVSAIIIITLFIGYYSVSSNIVSMLGSERLRINREMKLKWEVKAKQLIARYYKVLKIYEEMALSQAAFYIKDKAVIEAYKIANKGDLYDPYDKNSKQARIILKQYFKNNMDALKDVNKFDKFRLHFHTKNVHSLARIWLDGWQTIVDGKKTDITDNIFEFRNTIRKVIETRSFVSGIEIGKEGMVVRGVCPINTNEGEYLGSVEFIWPLSDVIKSLDSGAGVNYAVYMPEKFLKFAERLNNKDLYPVFNNKYVRVSSTDNALFRKIISTNLLDDIAGNFNHVILGHNYITGTKIIDFSGKIIGVLVITIDIKDDIMKLNKEQEKIHKNAEEFKTFLLIGSIVSFIFIISSIYIFLVRILRHLEIASLKLSESELNFRGLFMSQIDGYALHDIICDKNNNPIDYRFLLVNPAWEEQTGFKKENVVGKTVLELLPELEKSWIEKYGQVALTQKSIKFENYSHELKKYFEIYAFSPKKNQFASVSKDITQKKKDEKERSKMQDNILYTEKMRVIGQLAGGVAHDFNNKLSVIIGATELLQRKLKGTEHERMLDMSMQAAEYAADLSQKLLSFGKKNFMPFYEVNMLEVIGEVISLLKNKVSANIKFEEINNAGNVKVNGDKSQLFSSFINIGMNASQAMIGGGVIIIKLSNADLTEKDLLKYNNTIKAGHYLKITIKDTGKGIAKENMDKIFEPFFSTKGVGSGNGLGLPAALGVIEQHRGTISVESEVGIGTIVSVLLPNIK